jgi:8-oxo-dGTP pyrophosphatase MutT (NUDIX family)
LTGTVALKKPAAKTQYAALPWRQNGAAREVLLISSRDTGRWVIPKGWPIRGLTPAQSAAREAYEEAGVGGQIGKKPIGAFEYPKKLDSGKTQTCKVEVFALEQMIQHPSWPEQGQRKLQWFSLPEAANAVQEPQLKDIIRKLK